MMPRASGMAIVIAGILGFADVASAQETTTYTYDALGRVISVYRSGGPINGTASSYTYDAASNRTNVTVSGSPNGSGNGSGGASVQTTTYVVLPISGFTVIAITK